MADSAKLLLSVVFQNILEFSKQWSEVKVWFIIPLPAKRRLIGIEKISNGIQENLTSSIKEIDYILKLVSNCNSLSKAIHLNMQKLIQIQKKLKEETYLKRTPGTNQTVLNNFFYIIREESANFSKEDNKDLIIAIKYYSNEINSIRRDVTNKSSSLGSDYIENSVHKNNYEVVDNKLEKLQNRIHALNAIADVGDRREFYKEIAEIYLLYAQINEIIVRVKTNYEVILMNIMNCVK